MLVDQGGDVNATAQDGRTPLHNAVREGDPSVAMLLMEKGGQRRRERCRWDDTPLYCAAGNGAGPVVDLLIAGGADVNVAKPDGRTALHAAASRGHKEVVALLISHNADANAKTADGLSPADCARGAGCQDIALLLQSAGG